MKSHTPIELGSWVDTPYATCSTPQITRLLELPHFAWMIAEDLRYEAERIEKKAIKEEEAEALEDVEIAFTARSPEECPTSVELEDRARKLELELAAASDQAERTRQRQEIQQLRQLAREASRLTATEKAKRYAKIQAMRRVARRAGTASKKLERDTANEMRVAAQVIVDASSARRHTPVTVTSETLDTHTCVFGASGGGKTRLIHHLLQQQLQEGCSVLCIDPKPEAPREILSMAMRAGLKSHEVVYVTPRDGYEMPGWNPFLVEGESPATIAGAVHGFLEEQTGLPGVNMDILLRTALHICAAHRLSLEEVRRVVTDNDFRDDLLARARPADAGPPFDRAVAYLSRDFPKWGSSERATATRAVSVRLEKLLDTDFVRALLCAPMNTIDLAELWRQRMLIFFSLDRFLLSPDAQRVVGGILTFMAARTAMKVGGPEGRRVVMALDELGVSEDSLGSELAKITGFSRSQGIRLLVSSQHITSVSQELREALLGNTSIRIFFSLSSSDATNVAPLFVDTEIARRNKVHLKLTGDEMSRAWRLNMRNRDGQIPARRQFLPGGITEDEYVSQNIDTAVPPPPSEPSEPREAPSRIAAEIERYMEQIRAVTEIIDTFNAKQSSYRTLDKLGETSSKSASRVRLNGRSIDRQRSFFEKYLHITAKLVRERRNDGSVRLGVDYDMKDISKPQDKAQVAEKPAKITSRGDKAPNFFKRFIDTVTKLLKTESAPPVVQRYERSPTSYPALELNYRNVILPAYIARYIVPLLDYEHALESYRGETAEYEAQFGDEYEVMDEQAREEYRQLQREMQDEMQHKFIADFQQEYVGYPDIVEDLASFHTSFDLQDPWVEVEPGLPNVPLSSFVADLADASVRAKISAFGGGVQLVFVLPCFLSSVTPDTSLSSDASWRQALLKIKKRHPAVWMNGEKTESGIMRVIDVPDPLPDNSERLIAFARAATKNRAIPIIHGNGYGNESAPNDALVPDSGRETARRRTFDDEVNTE